MKHRPSCIELLAMTVDNIIINDSPCNDPEQQSSLRCYSAVRVNWPLYYIGLDRTSSGYDRRCTSEQPSLLNTSGVLPELGYSHTLGNRRYGINVVSPIVSRAFKSRVKCASTALTLLGVNLCIAFAPMTIVV